MNNQDIIARSLCITLAVILLIISVVGIIAWVIHNNQIKDLYQAIDILTEFVPKVK